MVEKAKLLGEDLLLVVRSEFGKASAAHNAGHGASYGMPMGQGGFGGPGGFGPGGFGGPQQGHMQQQHQPGGYYGYAQAQQPPQPQGEAPPPPPGEDAPPPPPDDGAAPPPDAPAGAGAAPGAAAPAAGAPGGPTGPETPEQKAYREYWAACVPLLSPRLVHLSTRTLTLSDSLLFTLLQLRLRHQRPGLPGLAGADVLRPAGRRRGRCGGSSWRADACGPWRRARAGVAGAGRRRAGRAGHLRRRVSSPPFPSLSLPCCAAH